MMRALAVALSLLVAISAAHAQDSADDQARRLLEEGRAYRQQGKIKQALENFSTVANAFAQTDYADDALLEMGRFQLEVEHDPVKAQASFDQITRRFAQSDAAPGAYYFLGLLGLQKARTPAELEDALAQFGRLETLYPTSTWIGPALLASAQIHRKAGRLQVAVAAARRAALEYPTSDVAAASLFEAAQDLALLGDPVAAMEEFQNVRNRYAESPWSARALDRITALYRLHGQPALPRSVDASYSFAAGEFLKDARGLVIGPKGEIWIASGKTNAVGMFDATAKLLSSVTAQDIRGIGLTTQEELLTTAKTAVKVGTRDIKTFTVPDEKGIPEPIDRIEAAAITPAGFFLIADGKRKRVFRFDAQGAFKGPFPDARPREVTRILIDPEGGILLLDREQKTITLLDESGRTIRSWGPRGAGFELRKPVDIAVDAFLNLYLADESGVVHAFAPSGQLLFSLTDGIARPTAVAVDASGGILVYDDKLQKLIRFN